MEQQEKATSQENQSPEDQFSEEQLEQVAGGKDVEDFFPDAVTNSTKDEKEEEVAGNKGLFFFKKKKFFGHGHHHH